MNCGCDTLVRIDWRRPLYGCNKCKKTYMTSETLYKTLCGMVDGYDKTIRTLSEKEEQEFQEESCHECHDSGMVPHNDYILAPCPLCNVEESTPEQELEYQALK